MLRLQSSSKQLCLDLLRADTEEQVIRILQSQGCWDDPSQWRLFGDRNDNFTTIGNQSRNPEAALVEKLVNSVDAVLMGECLSAGIRPNSPDAPRSIAEAVAQFFFGDRTKANTLGEISRWPDGMRRQVSDRITLAATGTLQNPCITVVDTGEGQTPNSMPETLLSLDKQNKVDVHFVQGKFNMGGTGALRFCGLNNLQLIISRRNPSIMSSVTDSAVADDPSMHQWGFTIVRRENPTDSKRLSTYTYLAPDHGQGILRFESDFMPLLPLRNRAYGRETAWGTAIKLYDYKLTGRSHILLRRGLLYRLDTLLPGVALPIRLHECRNYGGHKGSWDTTLTGLGVRLSDGRSENLEPGFPTSSTFTVRGQEMTSEVYAFKRGKAETYRRDEGVIFAVNGQTHGTLNKRFFSRGSVGMNRLEDSILVIVDCSRVDGRLREDLFMNSRDRMEQGGLLRDIERELESTLKENQLLRDLREGRRREDVESRLQDSKPLKEVLESIFRKSPQLAAFLGRRGPLSDPFRSRDIVSGNGFKGQQHPSYFRFRNRNYGEIITRTTAVNMRSRIAFETDAVNDYFSRNQFEGRANLKLRVASPLNSAVPDYRLNLNNGVATLNLPLPDSVSVGDSFEYELVVQDETLVDPFVNRFVIIAGPHQEPSGRNSERGRRRSDVRNNGNDDTPEGLALPPLIPIYEPEWESHDFDKTTALKVVHDPSEDEESTGNHTFYINMDNVYLKTELKTTKESPTLVNSRWQYGMVLVGMALLRENSMVELSNDANPESNGGDERMTAEEQVSKVTAAIGPVLLPLIEHLGALSDEEVGPES